MAECGGWRNDATRKLYTVLHDEWVFSSMIDDCLVQCAEKGYSKSDAADALYSKIVGWVYSDYNVALVNTPALIQALMMENPFEMDIDWGAIIDAFMKDYDDIVRAND